MFGWKRKWEWCIFLFPGSLLYSTPPLAPLTTRPAYLVTSPRHSYAGINLRADHTRKLSTHFFSLRPPLAKGGKAGYLSFLDSTAIVYCSINKLSTDNSSETLWRSPLPAGMLGHAHLVHLDHMIVSNVPSSGDLHSSESVRLQACPHRRISAS